MDQTEINKRIKDKKFMTISCWMCNDSHKNLENLDGELLYCYICERYFCEGKEVFDKND